MILFSRIKKGRHERLRVALLEVLEHYKAEDRRIIVMDKLEYEGYVGTVSYDKKLDYYTGEVKIDDRIYTYEGDTLKELQEDFEDIIDSIIAFEDMGDEDEV